MGAGYSVTRELHPLESSAFHGALLRQQSAQVFAISCAFIDLIFSCS